MSDSLTNIISPTKPDSVKTEPSSIFTKRGWKKADKSSAWKCVHCDKYFCNKYVLEIHNKKCRGGIKSLPEKEIGKEDKAKRNWRRADLTSPWKCLKCYKHFCNKYVLEEHDKRCKGKVPVINNSSVEISKHSCPICQKSFALKCNLVTHIKVTHATWDVDVVCPRRLKRVSCPVCPAKNKSIIALSNHVRDEHSDEEISGVFLFDTLAEFLTWKLEEEKRTVSCFIKKGGSQNINVQHYYCRRSGIYKSRGSKKRHLKVQGSCKAGSKCLASITAILSSRGVMVMYAPTHNGHSMVLQHVPLSLSERQEIAGMLSLGTSYDDLMDSIRDKLSSTEITRLHLIQRRDIINISKEFRLSRNQRRIDTDNVRIWIEICSQIDSEVVRFVRFPREDDRSSVNDFMIVLMSNIQADVLRQYGNHRVNCVDSTRGQSYLNFQLTTLLVVDDYGECFPVAFCVSSKVDSSCFEIFLERVRSAIGGPVVGAILLTDGASEFVDTWNAVMGPPDQHILCRWHIAKCWKDNISKINQSSEFKDQLYRSLWEILEITEKEKFHRVLETLLQDIEVDKSVTEFILYFRREYVSRPEVWAWSYGLGVTGNHYMRLDEAHETLVNVFMQGRKVIRRLDLSLNALLRLLRVKTLDCVLKRDETRHEKHVKDICQLHTLSLSLSREQMEVVKEGVWLVRDDCGDYTVNKAPSADVHLIHASNTHLCALLCSICNICAHTMTCTCLNYQLHNTVCTHIHAVVRIFGYEISDSQSDAAYAEEDNVSVMKQGSSDCDYRPPGSSVRPKGMGMIKIENPRSSIECKSIVVKSENNLREIDELMNCIRGSLTENMDNGNLSIVT